VIKGNRKISKCWATYGGFFVFALLLAWLGVEVELVISRVKSLCRTCPIARFGLVRSASSLVHLTAFSGIVGFEKAGSKIVIHL